jgi:hypothetical protein
LYQRRKDLLMRMQADLVLFVEKRERLKNRESA